MTRFELNTEIMIEVMRLLSANLEVKIRSSHINNNTKTKLLEANDMTARIAELTKTHNNLKR